MIFEAYEDIKNPELTVTCDGELDNKDLIILSIATSIDALAVGISFAFLNVNIVSSLFKYRNYNFYYMLFRCYDW